ncbi:iron chelate uptake ABC transporter family permease subunit [Bacillus hwajinpoensis]|uniref:Iron chelate uptake ABC transporter family permease subunit n=1 Tax=Guptibacillus hwajinpoensis TaxID=208199 RepID=A0A845EUD1_9BACL|nr:iron ABC transporter permease [Pseudalkalibacillus hwajinpoensis]MYL62503.1 iron chelate uptake ABC transporter family permease subunit [Pseudalkalibacillus hwajinpoensis]
MTHKLHSVNRKWFGIVIGFLLVMMLMVGSVVYGLTSITWATAWRAFTQFDGSNAHIIIIENRVPRALIGAAVGASLAVAGALMQAITRNPLASPSILGVNAGASFVIVIAVTFFSVSSLTTFSWLAFLGAAFASILVYVLGSLGREGLTPMKLTLAGAAMAAMFSSLTQGMLVLNEKALEDVLFWLAGSIEGRSLAMLYSVLPYIGVGLIGALLISTKINTLVIGEDVAKGLGQRTLLVKAGAALFIVFLAGGSVAVAGPIGFIGIVVPHVARFFTGPDYRWVIPYSAILGAILLLSADIAARYVILPLEAPVGVLTAVIGTPFFIYIARREFKQL